MLASVAELWQSREMPISRLLASLHERRARVERDAGDLLTFLGDHAYPEARNRARACRGKKDRAGDRYWSRVAVEVASREGRIIGQTVADRYEADRILPSASRINPEIARALADIAVGIADLARGQAGPTTLHNIGAWVRQAIDRSGSTAQVMLAGQAVIATCEELAEAAPECAEALKAGIYPPQAEAAGLRLRHLREAVEATCRGRRPPGTGDKDSGPLQKGSRFGSFRR